MTWGQDAADSAATPALLLWSRLVQEHNYDSTGQLVSD